MKAAALRHAASVRHGTALTLVALYAVLAAASLPLQRAVWAAVFVPGGNYGAASVLALAVLTVLYAVAAGGAAVIAPDGAGAVPWRVDRPKAVAALLVPGVATVAPLLVAWGVLDGFPNSGDEYAYVFQASHLAEGRLWVPAPEMGYTFVPHRTWISGDIWVSQYPPGWPLALAAAQAVGAPLWVVNPMVGGLGAAVLLGLAWRVAGARAAVAVTLLYALTPFTLFNAASFHSHTLSALLVLLVCAACRHFDESRGSGWLLAVGALLGLVTVTRYTSLLFLTPALAVWFWGQRTRGWTRVAALVTTGGLPFLVLLLAYQHAVTGSAFRTSYAVIDAPDVFLSLNPRGIADGLKFTAYRAVELAIWVSPTLLAVYAAALGIKLRRRDLAFYDLVFPAFIVGYVFFPSLGGNRYGPRYWFDAFPLVLLTVATAMPALSGWLGERWGGRGRAVVAHALLASACWMVTAYPSAVAGYAAQVWERQDLYRQVAEQRLTKAIVIVATPTEPKIVAEDLARNGTVLTGDVLYTRPGADVARLRAAFPDRTVWTYRRDSMAEPGTLVRE